MNRSKIKTDMMAPVLIAAAALLLAPAGAFAGFTDSGPGARTAAMGQAFSAVADDANAISANPAGLAQLAEPELSASYGRLYNGLTDDSKIGQGYFGLAFPVRRYLPGIMGVSWDELRLSDAYCETVFTGAYADKVSSRLSVGGSFKYLRKSYVSDGYTGTDPLFTGNGYAKSGLGIDLGGLYRLNKNYTFALVFKNVNQPDMGLGGTDRLPMQTRLGAAYRLTRGLVDMDLALSDSNYDISAGAERLFQGKYLFRVGFLAGNDSRRNVSLGFGGRFGSANFDYAFTLPLAGISGTSGSHRLAFGLKFGAAERQLEEEARRADAEAIRDARERLAEQEKQIRALEQKIREREDISRAAPAAQPAVPAAQPAVPAAQPAEAPVPGAEAVKAMEPDREKAFMESALQLMREELDRARKEAAEFREKLTSLEERGRKKPAAAPSAAPAAEKISVYVVEEGDTLQSIAEKVYGDGSKWAVIYKANSGSVGRGGAVKPGQTLLIP